MAPSNQNQHTPPSSTSSNGTSPNDAQPYRVVRKRNRVPLSCGPCRHRKLKCNRGHPCDNCTKRGDTSSCGYAAPKNKRQSGGGAGNAVGQTPDDMQNRIDRLEGLVLSLMTNGGSTDGGAAAARAVIDGSRSNSLSTASDLKLDVQGTDMIPEEGENGEDDSEVEQVSKGIGIMKVDNGKTLFASDAHWYAILGEISEVKRYFDSHKEDYTAHLAKVNAVNAKESPGTAFLLQGPPAKGKSEILASFPSKADSDRLIARYFNAYDPSVHIIHGPSFQRQYDAHWLNPAATSVAWLGLCFAMMTLSLQSYNRAGDEPLEYRGRALELSHDYRRLTAQCMLLADITQPIAQILDTLVLHVQGEYGRSRDAEPGVLFLTSLVVRLAMRMGYHRDPAPHANITPFQGEMRRRVWCFIRQCDLLISFQFGLPAMVRSDHSDTNPPLNIYDDELAEDMPSLPLSRPSILATPMTYMIAKSRITFLFGEIVERTQSLTHPPSYEETMALNARLRDVRATHPPLLQMRSFADSARDPANLIMQRLGLELVYLRSLFVLHRRFIARGRDSPRYAYSRRTCIDASMEMLSHQATLHEESQPGGRLRSVKWYISSLTTHDFLLAAVNVCIDLYHVAEAERRGVRKNGTAESPTTMAGESEFYAEERRRVMMQTIEHCITIWESVREQSMEAYKASIALRVMVEKLKAYGFQHQPPAATATAAAASGVPLWENGDAGFRTTAQQAPNRRHFGVFPNGGVSDFGRPGADDEQSAAMTLGMLSSGGLSPGFGLGPAAGGQAMAGAPDAKFPSSMAALLNEEGTGRTGLTPQFSGPDTAGPGGAVSPFSQMFGSGGAAGFGGMDVGAGGAGGVGVGDIDWGAWDSYLQGTGNVAMDPQLSQMWPMNLDLPAVDGSIPLQQGQQQGHGGGGGGGGDAFMGAGAPGGTM